MKHEKFTKVQEIKVDSYKSSQNIKDYTIENVKIPTKTQSSNSKEFSLRNLQIPQALKINNSTITYEKYIFGNVNGSSAALIKSSRSFPSEENSSYSIFLGLNGNKSIGLYNMETTTNLTTNLIQLSLKFSSIRTEYNKCETKPQVGVGIIYNPLGYIYYGGNDYFAYIGSSNVSSCTNVFGDYQIMKSNYTNNGEIIQYGNVKRAVFLNPNNLNLSLASHSGYTKTTDLIIQPLDGVPRVLALVYYENM